MSKAIDRADAPRMLSSYDRLLPQNLEAEVGVIGACLMDNDVIADVASIVEPSDFYRDTHQIVFRVLVEAMSAGRPMDPLLLTEELRRQDLFDRIGGDDTLFQLVGSVPHTANAAYHAHIVRDKSQLRDLIHAHSEGLKAAYAQQDTSDAIVAESQSAVLAISTRQAGAASISLDDAVAQAFARMNAREEGKYEGVPTGFRDLDDLVGYLANGSVAIVAARPSVGKTAFGTNICEHAAVVQGKSSLLISLEMNQGEVTDRVIAGAAGINSTLLKKPWDLDAEAMRNLGRARSKLAGKPLRIVDQSGMTMSKIAAVCRREKQLYGTQLICIDYAQLIAGTGHDDSRLSIQERTSEISRRVKDLARDLNIPIVLLSQLNRKAEGRADHVPMMSDLRDSGAWEQDADFVIMLHRPDYYDASDQPGLAQVYLYKNRNGPTGMVEMTFVRRHTRFHDGAPVDFGPAPAVDRRAS